MSTEIKEIKGRYERPVSYYETDYGECGIHINRFAGGKDNGVMLQLTIVGNTSGYIQLTKTQVDELIETLSNSFNYDMYPNE